MTGWEICLENERGPLPLSNRITEKTICTLPVTPSESMCGEVMALTSSCKYYVKPSAVESPRCSISWNARLR